MGVRVSECMPACGFDSFDPLPIFITTKRANKIPNGALERWCTYNKPSQTWAQAACAGGRRVQLRLPASLQTSVCLLHQPHFRVARVPHCMATKSFMKAVVLNTPVTCTKVYTMPSGVYSTPTMLLLKGPLPRTALPGVRTPPKRFWP